MRPLPMQRLHPLCWVALTPTTERAAIKLGVSVFTQSPSGMQQTLAPQKSRNLSPGVSPGIVPFPFSPPPPAAAEAGLPLPWLLLLAQWAWLGAS
jgi:hypothetical protein